MDKERKPHKHTEAATSSPSSPSEDSPPPMTDARCSTMSIWRSTSTISSASSPNGGGKTTLIKCILGLLRPTGGEIIKYHEPLTTGYLPQYNSIDRSFPISVLEVVLSGLSSKKSLTGRFNDRHREKARQVIHRMGLEGLEHRAIGQLSAWTTATRPAGTSHHQRPATAYSRRAEHLHRQALRSPPLPAAGGDQPRLRHHPRQP